MKFVFTKLLISAFLLFTFSSVQLLSQKENNDDDLSKEDIEKITSILSANDKKIESALKSDAKNYNAMKSDIENLSKLKDDAQKAMSIKDYQKKYSVAYGNALKKAGVDLNRIAKQLQSQYPKYIISVENHAIYFKKSDLPKITGGKTSGKTEEVKLSNFRESKDQSCALGSGGNVSQTSTSVKVTSNAVVAGGCRTFGEKILDYLIPKNVKNAKLKVKGTILVEGFAVGILGVATSFNGSYFNLDRNNIVGNSSYTTALFLWVAHNLEESDIEYESEFLPSKNINLVFYSRSSSMAGICCETHGRAEINNIDAKVVLSK
jgi:hypothetical protein